MSRFRRISTRRAALLASTALALTGLTVAAIPPATAQNATWLNAPGSADYNDGANWTPATVPTGTASFGTSGITALSLTSSVNTVGGWTFNAGAPAYTFDVTSIIGQLNFNGAGILINGGSATINATGSSQTMNFTNAATAGSATINSGNALSFFNTATAGSATISSGPNGYVFFRDSATASSANITGSAIFYDTATAANATITGLGGFNGTSTAANATITGAAAWGGNSTAADATITITTTGYFDNNSTAADATLTNNGLFSFKQNSTAGNAHITNAGSLAFGDNSTAANATIISNGTLRFITNATAASASITNNLSMSFELDSTAGSATITNGNSGVLDFYERSTAGSATIASTGTVNFNDTSTAGSARINATGASSVNFFNSSSAGSAKINATGASSVNFFNSSSAGNAGIPAQIDVQGGSSVNFYDTSTTGNASINLGGASANKIIFNNASTAGNAHIFGNSGGTEVLFKNTSTAGSANILSNSIMRFNGSSTAGNATLDIGGTLQFLDNSTAGSAAIDTSGAVSFNDTSSGGTARLDAGATGTFDFSGLTSSGTTAGSFEGAGTFKLGPKTITVGGNNLSTTLDGIIEGNGGALVKTGTGTLTLAGTNTYTGATTINAGTLRVDGSIAASSGVAVNSGGTLSGTGIVGNTTVNSGGTLAAGNGTAGSSLTVNGTLGLNAASTYAVNVNPATSSFANVSGAATLGGATVNAIFAPGSYVSKKYIILTAGSINGTFGTLTNTNIPANFHDSLSYDATHAYLNLDLTFTTPATGTINGNQNNVANALINFFNTTGGIPLTFATLSAPALSQAAGETATGSQQGTFNAMTQFLGLMTDPFTAGRANGANAPAYAEEEDSVANAYAASGKPRSKNERDAYAAVYSKAPLARNYDPRWSVWGAGFGGSQTTDGNTTLGSNTTTSRLFGVAAGADYFFSPNTVAGFALAGGGTSFGVNGFGSGRSDLFQAGGFIRHTVGPAYLTGALAYGWQDVTTDRTVTIAGIDRLRAQFNANAFSGRAEAGYRFVGPWIGGVGITPYAAGQFTTFELPAYTEQVVSGANTFALAYAAKSVTATRSELGLRADKSFAMPTPFSPCAAAPPGRTISIPTAPSPPPSRPCPARPSSSTAHGRPATPR